MKSRIRPVLVVSAVLSLAACDKSAPPAAAAPTPASLTDDSQLAEARDALQRQALEIETKTALMDKQLAEMQQSLKEHENAELRGSLESLKQQNDELRTQADAVRRQSDAITQRIAATPPPPMAPQPMGEPDYSLFYDDLAPYGSWFEASGYGFCWRPTISVAGWRPYVDGCWVWSSFGWTWQSNEPFGWAVYHYGRWINLAGYGWVWVPGSEWAPAWVAWRQSRDCVGWAPLPPQQGVCTGVYRDCDSIYHLGPASYTFINTSQFVSPTYLSIYAPVTLQTAIFQQSVNVTQIVPSRGHGHAFAQQGGPPRKQVEQVCGLPVPQRQVQTLPAGQLPPQHRRHGPGDAAAPVARVELPHLTPGGHMMRPEIREHIQRPTPMSGFEGVPQDAVSDIRQNIAQEKATAVVQQQAAQHQPQHGRVTHEAPSVVNAPPAVTPHETVRPASPVERPVENAVAQPRPEHGQHMRNGFPQHAFEAPAAPMTNAPAQETVRPAAVAAESGPGMAREHRRHDQATVGAAPAVMQQSVTTGNAGAAQATAEAERARQHAAHEQARAAEMQQRQQQEMQARAMAEKQAAEQAAATAAESEKNRMQAQAAQQQQEMAAQQQQQQRAVAEQAAAEAEKTRMQAAAAQQEALAAQQQRMAADQAAAENERARQAQATAVQQQQEMAAQQQRAAAERMAAEQAAAETARAQQAQAQAAAMQQRQQEEATRRAAEEQQMRAQQEAERRTQEMAQRQAEEQARRQQEMAQRQQEEAARRAQEAEMQRAQEQARRAAEEQQMRAQQEAAQRAQEMAQRQAEEARRAQEHAQRQAEEQSRRAQEEAHRAAAEAARNRPQP